MLADVTWSLAFVTGTVAEASGRLRGLLQRVARAGPGHKQGQYRLPLHALQAFLAMF